MADLGVPGNYKARIKSVSVSEASTGTPSIDFLCEVLMYVNDDGLEEEVPEGMEKTVYRYVTDGTAKRTIADLRTLGYDRDNFDGCDPEGENPFDFAGKEVGLRMKIETYKDTDRERWEFEFSGATKPLEKKKLAGLNAKFSNLFKASPSAAPANGTKTPAAKAAAATAKQGEEVF